MVTSSPAKPLTRLPAKLSATALRLTRAAVLFVGPGKVTLDSGSTFVWGGGWIGGLASATGFTQVYVLYGSSSATVTSQPAASAAAAFPASTIPIAVVTADVYGFVRGITDARTSVVTGIIPGSWHYANDGPAGWQFKRISA